MGISLVTALISQNTQQNHEEIGRAVTAFNGVLRHPALRAFLDPTTLDGRATLDGLVTQQATLIAYIDDFKLLMLLSVAVMPLLLLLRPPRASSAPADDHAMVME